MEQIKFSNLLYHSAKSVQKHLWKTFPEAYRAALRFLFDENIDLGTRVREFQDQVSGIYRMVEPKLSHHHDERTIATLLSIKYPEVYPIYKASYYEAYCKFLGVSPAKKDEKYVHYIGLIKDLVQLIKLDDELITLVNSLKTPTCYADPEYLLLAQDILYQYFREIAKESEKTNVRYWLYSPGEQAKKWNEFYELGCMALGWDALGDLKAFSSKDDIKSELLKVYGGTTDKKNDTTANDAFANKIEIGDIIIVKQGLNKLLGYGEVTSDYYFDEEALDYKHRRDVNWIKKGVWLVEQDTLVLKTLTDVTSYKSPFNQQQSYPNYLLAIMNNEIKEAEPKSLAVLKYKKQIILQGPPGTGKTREAKQLAQSLLHLENFEESDQFKLIQFHPSYTYEDFVRGIVAKPNPEGEGIVYEAENKVLAEFAERALHNPSLNYVLIIDEINRANLSSVLGELIYALEYRGKAVDSMYAVKGNKQLVLPPNLYLIGTMNTADRSVGHIDYAIRRRFAFVDVLPKTLENDTDVYFYKEAFNAVCKMFTVDNVISDFKPNDVALGHSYFMVKKEDNMTKEQANEIFKLKLEFEILPLLKEYNKDGIFIKDISEEIENLATNITI